MEAASTLSALEAKKKESVQGVVDTVLGKCVFKRLQRESLHGAFNGSEGACSDEEDNR